MRGADVQQGGLFSYVSVESRIPANHPLRAVRTLLDEALASMSRDFDRVYAEGGRSSVPPERLWALVLQVLYSIRCRSAFRAHSPPTRPTTLPASSPPCASAASRRLPDEPAFAQAGRGDLRLG